MYTEEDQKEKEETTTMMDEDSVLGYLDSGCAWIFVEENNDEWNVQDSVLLASVLESLLV
jgi:hypothetical protein